MPTDEQSAIQLCQRGELSAFTSLYDAYVTKIFSYIIYRVRHREIAEDLVSTTFVKALERIGTYESGRGTFSAWLYRIARNTVFDHYRTAHPAQPLDEAGGTAAPDDVARQVGARLELEKVGEYLDNFSPDIRDLIIMRVWDGLAYAEIARISGRSEAACKMSVSRSLARIQKELAAVVAVLLLVIYKL